MRNKLTVILLILLPACIFAQSTIDTNTVTAATHLFDLSFTNAEKDSMVDGLKDNVVLYQKIHSLPISNSLSYPFGFNPTPVGFVIPTRQEKINWMIPTNVNLPKNKTELAFYSVMQLASLIKNKKITSVVLTMFFINRLKK